MTSFGRHLDVMCTQGSVNTFRKEKDSRNANYCIHYNDKVAVNLSSKNDVSRYYFFSNPKSAKMKIRKMVHL